MKEPNIPTPITELHMPRWEELPSVALYLDQVVTLINNCLLPILSFTLDEKKENTILTKTMINNYVKHCLIDPPEKKKYEKTQLAKLFVICVLKQVYTMNDIKCLINIAVTESDIQSSYNQFCIQFENALKSTYSQHNFFDNVENNNNRYLLKIVLLSCAYKIYTQNITKNSMN